MPKILIVTGDGGESYEALYAVHRFQEEGWEAAVAAPSRRRMNLVMHDFQPGWDTYIERPGYGMEADLDFAAVHVEDYDAVMLLGGRAPEYLRNDASMISLVREFAAHNHVICAVGHGVQVLTAAGLATGKTLTGHPHVYVEVEREGGVYSDKPAVRDGRIITAQSWKYHPEFYREVFTCLNETTRV